MGHVDHGGTQVLMKAFELRTHLDPQLGIQIRERLIHQKSSGISHQRTPQGNSLLLASGQFTRSPFQ